MTTASRKSMRPKAATTPKAGTSDQPVGTSTKGKGKAVPVDTLLSDALKAHGKPGVLLDTLEDRYKAAEAASAGILAWVKVARAWESAKRSGREFARLTAIDPVERPNGDPNALGRLLDIGNLIEASRKGTGSVTMSVRAARATTTSHTRAAIAKACDEMRAGKDPLGTKTKRAPSTAPSAHKRKPAPVKTTVVTPDLFVGALSQVLAGLGDVTKAATLVEIARLAREIETKATAAAAHAAVRPGRKPAATPATMAS